MIMYLPTASKCSFPVPNDENRPLLMVVIEEPVDAVVTAALASIIILALRCAFSTGDNVGSASNFEKKILVPWM